MNKPPLSDIRVIDLSHVVAGPYCTMLLADLGAEVIKIENPIKPDLSREIGPLIIDSEGRNYSARFLGLNRNKKAITLNLKHPKGKVILKDLVKLCDVLVENFSPGVMEKLGLGYKVLCELNPKLVYAAISGFGHLEPTPFQDRPSFDIIAQAMGGLMEMTGDPEGAPVRTGVSVGDYYPSLMAAFAIMVALHARTNTGRGQMVDVAMYDSIVSLTEAFVADYSLTKEAKTRMGNVLNAPYGIFMAKDGYMVIAALSQDMWERLCHVMGKPEYINDPRLRTFSDRRENFQECFAPILKEWIWQQEKNEVINLLLKNKIPAAPVNTIKDLFECPHLAARGMLTPVPHPALGSFLLSGIPFKLSEMSARPHNSPPDLGQNNPEILGNLLGYSESDLGKLREDGVI